ncbi:MAG: hypothetical protein V4793_47315, partial [Paraburkholderia tropica]
LTGKAAALSSLRAARSGPEADKPAFSREFPPIWGRFVRDLRTRHDPRGAAANRRTAQCDHRAITA